MQLQERQADLLCVCVWTNVYLHIVGYGQYKERYRGLGASYLRKLNPLRNSEKDWQRGCWNRDVGADIEEQAELRKELYKCVHGVSDSPNLFGKICGPRSISPSFSSNLTFLRP